MGNQTITPQAQDSELATYAPLLTKEAGLIDWTHPAWHIANRIRGLSPWPGCYTFLHDQRLVIWKATAEPVEGAKSGSIPGTIQEVSKKDFLVWTGEGLLRVTEVQPANKKRMTVEQFLQGRGLQSGDRFVSDP